MSAHEIVVGASLSLSGRFAAQGLQAHQGLTFWADDVNRASGLLVRPGQARRPVRLVILDDAGRRALAAEQTRRLIVQERVDLLFGPYGSAPALAATEVAAEHDRTLWNHGGSSDAIIARGWRHVVNVLSPASSYFAPLLEMATQSLGQPIRSVALLRRASGTFPAAVIGGARDQARRLGLEIVWDGTYEESSPQPRPQTPSPHPSPRGRGGWSHGLPLPLGEGWGEGSVREGQGEATPQHATLVRQLASVAPDLILGAGTTEADIAFARALRAMHTPDTQAPLVGLVAAAVQPFQNALGADADGFCGPSQWEPTLRNTPEIGPTSAQFASAFLARFAVEPDYPAAQAYAAGLIAARCVEVAGSLDDHALRAIAAQLDTTTFYGRFRTDPATGQQAGHQIVVAQWQAGRKQVVWPPALATATWSQPG